MSRICVLLLALTLPTAAAAQEVTTGATGWSRNWKVEAAPTFGADRAVAPFPVGDEIVDDSEFSAGAEFGRTFRNGATLTLAPGASYSPNQFDAEEPASALSLGATLKLPITRAVAAPDKLAWVLSYGVRADFDEAFEDYARTDQTFGLGVQFTNVLTTVCNTAAARIGGECVRRNGWTYTITPNLKWVESTDHDRERFNPGLTASVEWPMGEFSSLYVDAAIDRRLYETVDAPNGEQRRDMRVAATAGVDLSRWAQQAYKLPEAFSFRLGVRWVALSSNDPAAESDQVYVVPELAWKQSF